ncbi:hypothetical protein YDYSG_00150 [Paenibacillus tyrfis]|uniref:ferric reductase n=1 Tax=Paenibacillus tyrfis TaxID=1501230 RepID=UPI002492BAC2|nr:ferric reductase [Paenibacillus tyrfis]GLI03985.1 hypothetical protein YDYSG_00150 [Paenibacillus tyrfis]
MIPWIVDWPVWQIIRVTGIVSFVSLSLGIALGIMYSYPVWPAKSKTKLFKLHRLFNNAGIVLMLLHAAFPVISTYMPFSWKEVLLPFAAQHDAVLNGIGTLAGYGLIVVLLSTDLRNAIGKKLWHLIHLLSYPIFILVAVHGFFLGSDTVMAGIRWTYIGSFILIGLLTIGRLMFLSSPGAAVK